MSGTPREMRWTSASLPVPRTPSSVSTAASSVTSQPGCGWGPRSLGVLRSQVDHRSPDGGPSRSSGAMVSSHSMSSSSRRFLPRRRCSERLGTAGSPGRMLHRRRGQIGGWPMGGAETREGHAKAVTGHPPFPAGASNAPESLPSGASSAPGDQRARFRQSPGRAATGFIPSRAPGRHAAAARDGVPAVDAGSTEERRSAPSAVAWSTCHGLVEGLDEGGRWFLRRGSGTAPLSAEEKRTLAEMLVGVPQRHDRRARRCAGQAGVRPTDSGPEAGTRDPAAQRGSSGRARSTIVRL